MLVALLLLAVLFASACAASPPPNTPEPTRPPEPTANLAATVEAAVRATSQAVPTATMAPTVAPTAAPLPTTLTQEDAVAVMKRYAVFIATEDGTGSGISLGGGRVLTNYHVVEGASRVVVRFADGRQEPVRILQVDPRRDLALVQSSFTDEPAAAVGDTRTLRAAENLFVVGYPRATAIGAQDSTVTRGIFSARWQSPQGVWHVQTDAPMNPGNSGGPVGDAQGRLAGVATWGVRGSSGLNFAVASDEVAAFLDGGGQPPEAVQPPPGAGPALVPPSARPELSGHATSQRTVTPGGFITLSYTTVNPGGVPVPVVLGASIRAAGGGTWIDDPGNDVPVAVQPGSGTYTRLFRVPAGTPPGSYDVAWGMFSPNKQKSYGLQVEPGILSVALSVSVAPAPAPAAQPSTAPADAVRQFYAFLNARNYSAAWNLLSPEYQSTLNYDGWVRGYQTTRSVQTPSVRTASQSGGTATVELTIVSVDATAGGTVTKTFQGAWGMVLVNGTWKLGSPSIKQVG